MRLNFSLGKLSLPLSSTQSEQVGLTCLKPVWRIRSITLFQGSRPRPWQVLEKGSIAITKLMRFITALHKVDCQKYLLTWKCCLRWSSHPYACFARCSWVPWLPLYFTLLNRNTNLETVPLAQLEQCSVNILMPQFREVLAARQTSP